MPLKTLFIYRKGIKMDFQSFIHTLHAKVQLFSGADCEITLEEVIKNNGFKRIGLMAKKEGISTYPTVYIEDYYSSELTESEIEYLAMKLARSLANSIPKEDIDVSSFINFDTAKKRIVFKVINAELNKNELLDIPYRRFHNLAIVCYYLMDEFDSENDKEPRNASILIRKSHIDVWNTTEEEIFELAKVNTPDLLPASIESLSDVVCNMTNMNLGCENIPLYVATNDRKHFGAGVLIYEGVLKAFADEIGSNLYILPSSIHEIILLRENSEYMTADAKELLETVIAVNANEVDPKEVLADSVYYYDRELDEIVWVC